MPRIYSDPRVCAHCGEVFHRWSGQVNAKYCSRKCNCDARRTTEGQRRAGLAGAAVIKATKRGTGTADWYVKEDGRHQHRVVAERMLGRALRPGEIVHHKDDNKKNNDPTNLQVFASQAEHARHHALQAWARKRMAS